MYVCIEDEGEPRIVGWTSLEAPPQHDCVRFPWAPRVPVGSPLVPNVEITQHEFAVRRVYPVAQNWPYMRGERVILLAEGDDPAVLPGWRPMQERPTAVYARRRADGVDLQLSRISMADLMQLAAMHIPRILARPPGGEDTGDLGFAPEVPLYWAEADHGGVAVHPAASDEYEIIVQRERRFRFEEPRRPFVFGDTGRRTVAWSEPQDPARWGDSIRVIGDAPHGELAAAMEADLRCNEIEWKDRVNAIVSCRERYKRIILDVKLIITGDPSEIRRLMREDADRMAADVLNRSTYSNIPGPGLTLEALNQSIEEARAATHMRGFQSELQQAALTTEYQRYQQYAAMQAQAMAAQQQAAMGPALGQYAIGFLNPRAVWGVTPPPPDPAAVTRARGLLRRLVGPEQWREFERDGKITERIGTDEYVIRPGGMIEVRRFARIAGVPILRKHERWCVNPDAYDGDARLPLEDQAIAQLLHLRADPARLRARANIFPG